MVDFTSRLAVCSVSIIAEFGARPLRLKNGARHRRCRARSEVAFPVVTRRDTFANGTTLSNLFYDALGRKIGRTEDDSPTTVTGYDQHENFWIMPVLFVLSCLCSMFVFQDQPKWEIPAWTMSHAAGARICYYIIRFWRQAANETQITC